MEIKSNGSILLFGKEIKERAMDKVQGGPRKEIVLTKEKIKACYPMNLKVSFTYKGNTTTQSQDLYYHFCQSLHEEFSETEYTNFQKNEDYTEDERVIFVPKD